MNTIKVPTNDRKFYRQLLELFRSIPPFNKLRSREVDVLSQILYQNNKHKIIPTKTRHLVVFSTEVRKEMRDYLGVSEEIFNNNLSGLRKKGLITESNHLIPSLESLFFNQEYILQFKFISK